MMSKYIWQLRPGLEFDVTSVSSSMPADSSVWVFSKIRGVPFLGVPIIRAIVFWGLYWGPLIFWETTI